MSLYLKYRPKTIEELDLESVRKTLGGIVKANKTSHAYLLTGPRGAGKTSTARILARIVNCEKNKGKLGEPCNECKACLSILDGSAVDVVEIDAASNRGIDDIRELKEKIRLAPAILPKKVYIIDEVHMLTTEAFNALLKTLEEPPAHAIFVLCTTEAHKVPETIGSRCVRIAFTKATADEMLRSFARVVSGEGSKAEEGALEYLALAVDGSFRDGVKILDQVLVPGEEISLKLVQEAVEGVAGYSVVPLAEALVKKDAASAIKLFHTAAAKGVDIGYLLISTIRVLRDAMLASYGVGTSKLGGSVDKEITKLIVALDEVARKLALTQVPNVLVEVAIVEWCGGGGENHKPTVPKSPNPSPEPKPHREEKPVEEALPIVASGDALDVWKKVMGSLNGDSISMGALLSKANPAMMQGDTLTIRVRYDFHRQALMTNKIRLKLEEMVSKAVGKTMKVRCEVGEVTKLQLPEANGTMAQAAEIFGVKEE